MAQIRHLRDGEDRADGLTADEVCRLHGDRICQMKLTNANANAQYRGPDVRREWDTEWLITPIPTWDAPRNARS